MADFNIFNVVDEFNPTIKKYGKEIQVVKNIKKDDCYSIDILDIDCDNNIYGVRTFASFIPESEVADNVKAAYQSIMDIYGHNDGVFFSYRAINGWTHGIAALIESLTEYALFFRDGNGTIECVSDNPKGIDAYEDREGTFCVLAEDYYPALNQIREHDDFGVER